MHNKAYVVKNLIQRGTDVIAKISFTKIQELQLIIKFKNILISNVTIKDIPLNIYRINDILSNNKMLIII